MMGVGFSFFLTQSWTKYLNSQFVFGILLPLLFSTFLPPHLFLHAHLFTLNSSFL